MMRSVSILAASIAAVAVVPCALADVAGDVAITSNTPSVSHARVGDKITFEVTETNLGPIDAELDVDGTRTTSNLEWAGVDCGRVSSDGAFCEQGIYPTGTSFVARYSFTVLRGPRIVTFTPCVADWIDTNPSNDCRPASVRVIGRD